MPRRRARRSGRPPAADAERTRAALLDAAEEEFADCGFAGARVLSIARRAGLSHGMLRYYFETKERLYEAVVERLFARHLALTRARLAAGAAAPAAREFVMEAFDLFWEHPNQVRIMLWELAAVEQRVERAARPFFDAIVSALPPLDPARPANRAAGHDPRDVFATLLGSLVIYFFRDPSLERLFGAERFGEADRQRRRAHLGALVDLFF